MNQHSPLAVTRLLGRMAAGDATAADELLPQVYDQLRALADGLMRDQGAQHTLQPTALVNEAWIRLTGGSYESREHFAAVAARAMRSVLVDHARRRRADKRGGGSARIALDDMADLFESRGPDLLELDDALERLTKVDPELSRLVELRFFAGLSIEDTARTMGSSTASVTRAWRVARLWLARELGAA